MALKRSAVRSRYPPLEPGNFYYPVLCLRGKQNYVPIPNLVSTITPAR